MTRIRFEDLPSTNTPRNAENLNKLNNVVISSTEPTTGEEVWIQKTDTDKKIYIKNDNDVYEEFYDETKLENYSLAEKRIGNWIDGKPLYEKTYVSNSTTVNLDDIPYGFLFAHEVIVELSTGATFSTGRYQSSTDYFTFYAYKNTSNRVVKKRA